MIKTPEARYAVFDGHNDLLARLFLEGGEDAAASFAQGRPNGHLDAQRCRAGGFGGGFFAIWVPSPQHGTRKALDSAEAMSSTQYDVPLPPMVPQTHALDVARRQIATLKALERQGSLAICTSSADLDATTAEGRIAALMHMEGAEAIDPDLEILDEFHALGLRSLGLVWSRPTLFGHGVPFRFPAAPDIGPGLTDAGKRLVARCNKLGIAIDLSHLNAAGFADVERLSEAPLIATHSNVHALCPHARNLTDRQLDAVAASGGVVGLNFATAFLRADGRMLRDTPVEIMIAHLRAMIARMGEDHVALGSDFDGAVVPAAIGHAGGLPVLTQAMEDAGFGADLITKVCRGNWLRVLKATLGA